MFPAFDELSKWNDKTRKTRKVHTSIFFTLTEHVNKESQHQIQEHFYFIIYSSLDWPNQARIQKIIIIKLKVKIKQALKMTKLMEWLSALIAFLAVYLYLLTGEPKLPEEMQSLIKYLPIYLIGTFGVSITTNYSFGAMHLH